jgi:deoxyadenosine/deoxycytidine kinase
MKRIRKRNRDFEKPIDQDYIEQLNQAYNNFFFHYNDAPLLVIKTDGIDFVANSSHLDDLVEQIKKPRTRIMYYAPAGDVQGQIM